MAGPAVVGSVLAPDYSTTGDQQITTALAVGRQFTMIF